MASTSSNIKWEEISNWTVLSPSQHDALMQQLGTNAGGGLGAKWAQMQQTTTMKCHDCGAYLLAGTRERCPTCHGIEMKVRAEKEKMEREERLEAQKKGNPLYGEYDEVAGF